LCLDVANNSAEPRTNVQQWTDNGNDAQRWKLDLVKPITTLGTAKFSNSALHSEDVRPVLNVYPNPVGNTLSFTSEMTNIQIRVFSETGSLVKEQILKNNSLDVSGLATGIYFAVFEKDGTKMTKRFIKK